MARKSKTSLPRKFRSGFEQEVAEQAFRSDRGATYESLKLPYTYYYLPDVILSNDIIIEIKGYFSPDDRRKMLAVKKDNPDRDIRLVFQRADNRLKGSKTTYWQWAERHGFGWAEGHIPVSWFKEKRREAQNGKDTSSNS